MSSVSALPSVTIAPVIVALPSVVRLPVIFVFAVMFIVLSAESIFKLPTKLSSLFERNLTKSDLTWVSSIKNVLPAVVTFSESVLLKSILAASISVLPVSWFTKSAEPTL